MGGIGGTMFLIGAIGTAGTIEQNGNPTIALILTVLGLILMGVSIRNENKEKVHDYTRNTDFRLHFLP